MKLCTYDLETIRTVFTACFLDYETRKRKEFVLYDDPKVLVDLVQFLLRLKKADYYLIGINNLNFDAQVLEFILKNHEEWLKMGYSAQDMVTFIYNHAQYIINLDEKEKWTALVPEYKLSIKQIDLFKQKHYDGKAKMGTSLKWLQFTMRYPTVEEMPIAHDASITKEDLPTILRYNWNDVESTDAFFTKNRFETDLRLTLSEQYKMNLLNASEPRLAKMIFAHFLCEEMGIDYRDLKDMRTFRKEIPLRKVIFPYISFKTAELQHILEVVQKQVINPNVKAEFEHTFWYGGIETVLAMGGIHACCKPGVYEATDEMMIEDIDVTSFYPNLAIENGIRPKHLGSAFNKVYKMIFEERQKIPKKDPRNYVFKIILNSTYGLSKEINSYLYDPFFTYSITINGQLSILMLVESLVTQIPGLKIFQENTDGITIGYHPQYRDRVAELCREWCDTTRLKLEYAYYKKMVIRDVNNYMATKTDFDWSEYQAHIQEGKKRADYGKIKHKGTFEIEMDYHKNPSCVVVPMAAESHFFGTLSYREFIYQHRNIYDFLAGVKKKSDFDLNLHVLEHRPVELKFDDPVAFLKQHGWEPYEGGTWVKDEWIKNGEPYEKMAVSMKDAIASIQHKHYMSQHTLYPQQKVTRYYISHGGGVLTKDYHSGKKAGSRVQVESGWTVQPLNDIGQVMVTHYPDLNLSYYVKEAERLVYSIQKNHNQLKLF